uniref:Uncharacterized protein n=1 Tax=Mus musculus TaxID=10090 RepID=Q8BV98_MOUSE|nr:unnamed protein product [Mus musculus]BAE36158.1 unnamed protein product [Mus musculus]
MVEATSAVPCVTLWPAAVPPCVTHSGPLSKVLAEQQIQVFLLGTFSAYLCIAYIQARKLFLKVSTLTALNTHDPQNTRDRLRESTQLKDDKVLGPVSYYNWKPCNRS